MNIRGIGDFKNEPKKDDKDKKNTDSYTGGHSSGLAVENPDEDWMENMKKQPDQKEDYDKSENKLTLTVYKNGFVVDEGVFRDVLEPANKKFMDEIEKGFIPQELVDQGKTQLAIALIDKKTEIYTPPVPEKKFQAFVGGGVTMGEIKSESLGIFKDVNFSVDRNKPMTKINIRLNNGESITQEFNLSHTVQDIFSFVSNTAPVIGTFQLVEGFPPKPLADMSKTIEQARLQGTSITQRLS